MVRTTVPDTVAVPATVNADSTAAPDTDSEPAITAAPETVMPELKTAAPDTVMVDLNRTAESKKAAPDMEAVPATYRLVNCASARPLGILVAPHTFEPWYLTRL